MYFSMRKVVFTPDPMNQTGGLVEPASGERPDKIGVYLSRNDGKTNGLPIWLFDLDPGQEELAKWLIETLNYSSDDLPESVKVCCGFMTWIGQEHDDGWHWDLFECPTCRRKERGNESLCDPQQCNPVPEYSPEDDQV